MRTADKNVIKKTFTHLPPTSADFEKIEIDGAIAHKGYRCIFEKAYLCPCKSKSGEHLQSCKNCGGSGWWFANPTKTTFLIMSVTADPKMQEAALREWGMVDMGSVYVTAMNDDKFSFMDRITILNATAEHSQVIYPSVNLDGDYFAFTKYIIKSIVYVGIYVDNETKIKRLIEDEDYTFKDNIILFKTELDVDANSQVTIRYVHHPVFHITNVVRESMSSTKSEAPQSQRRFELPVRGIALRAHLLKEAENFSGDRLLDNSWIPEECEQEDLTAFERQLRYTPIETVYESLTEAQRDALDVLLGNEDDGMVEIGSAVVAGRVLDCNDKTIMYFDMSTPFTVSDTITLNEILNLRELSIRFNVTDDTALVKFPANFVGTDPRFTNGTREFDCSATGVGVYIATAWTVDQTAWYVTFSPNPL